MQAARVGVSALGAVGGYFGAKKLVSMTNNMKMPAIVIGAIPIIAAVAGFAIVYHAYGDPAPGISYANATGGDSVNWHLNTRPGATPANFKKDAGRVVENPGFWTIARSVLHI